MANKLQQFYTLKFPSSRLKKSKFSINISLDDARKNGEVITINNSELLRALFRYKNMEYSQKELEILLRTRRNLKKSENTEENRRKIEIITEKIEKTLFVEDLVSIEFENKTHYLTIVKRNGFYINGIRFVPFMASAGMIRRNTALFINNNLKHPLMDILENGRDESVEIVPAKFGAYFSLYSSSTLPVSFPRFAVIPDKTINTIRRVDFVTYAGEGVDDNVTECDKELSLNAFDGQGLIKPYLAEQWSRELGLDYVFSAAVIRAPFLKGLVVTFDLDRFASEISGRKKFTDIYGKERFIDDVDLIISESMFKLWSSYADTEAYIKQCNINKLGFSVAKVSPKRDKSYSRTSYQFLQILSMNEVDVARFCEPTVDWFRNLSGKDYFSMILYATGESGFEPKDFNKLDTHVKAVLLNPALIRDRYIQQKFIKSIEKKKKESYMGSLLINANYQFMISDPFYQACHLFKLDTPPLLSEGEHFSAYWLKRGVKTVGAIRSPIVHHSEFGVLNLQDREDVRSWYSHIHSGVVFPANGVGMDCAIHGGSDFDGDLICTVDNSIMVSNRVTGLPIVYESEKAKKAKVDSRNDAEQVDAQLRGHNSKVGFATNISSSIYTLLEEFPVGSVEHDTLLNRLKIGRVIQGEIIDGVKGLNIPPFRDHWVKPQKIEKDTSPEDRKRMELYNRIVCTVRPSYFRFLYPHYMTRYNQEIRRYNLFSLLSFGRGFSDIVSDPNASEEEKDLVDRYKNRSFFLDNNSVVNMISRYMRGTVGLVGRYSSKASRDFNYTVLVDKDHILNSYKLAQMKSIIKEYKSFKKGLRNKKDKGYENLDAFIAYLRKTCFSDISSSESELVDYAVEATYGGEVGMIEFVWKMFPSGIIENIVKSSSGLIMFPVSDENGEIEYLWEKYTIQEFSLEDIYED